MFRLLALTVLVASLGCTREGIPSPADSEMTDEARSTNGLHFESPAPNNVPELKYPEKSEVLRLIVRARAFETIGKFEDALNLADQAVAIDPNSPKANQLKVKLEELLRRM